MKLYIARISYGDDPLHTNRLIQLCLRLSQLGIPFHLAEPLWDSLIPRGRNRVARKFLETSDCTHLLNIDSDIIFQPWDVERLISANLDFVGAPYPLKGHNLSPSVVGSLIADGERRDGFLEAGDIGTGFLLLSRAVFDALAPHAAKYSTDIVGDPSTREIEFYGCGVEDALREDSQYLSEDWWISRAWRATGGKCWLDGEAKLGHTGRNVWMMGQSLNEGLRAAVPEDCTCKTAIGALCPEHNKGQR